MPKGGISCALICHASQSISEQETISPYTLYKSQLNMYICLLFAYTHWINSIKLHPDRQSYHKMAGHSILGQIVFGKVTCSDPKSGANVLNTHKDFLLKQIIPLHLSIFHIKRCMDHSIPFCFNLYLRINLHFPRMLNTSKLFEIWITLDQR